MRFELLALPQSACLLAHSSLSPFSLYTFHLSFFLSSVLLSTFSFLSILSLSFLYPILSNQNYL